MTTIVVPLAGPDAYSADGQIRALVDWNGSPIFAAILNKRSWIKAIQTSDQLIFVIRKEKPHHEILADEINRAFPFAQIIVLDKPTNGALITCLIGALAGIYPENPVILDLADIYFELELSLEAIFSNEKVDGVIPYFHSDSQVYSYLEIQKRDSLVLKTREKEVISNNASAGVYLFRNMKVLFEAANWAFANESTSKICGKFFVCPIYNGLIANGSFVKAIKVNAEISFSEIFHLND